MIRYENTLINPKDLSYVSLMSSGNTVVICLKGGEDRYIQCKSKAAAIAFIDAIEQATNEA